MSTRSTAFFCFRSLEARDSRPEGLLLYKVYNLRPLITLTVCFAKASIGKEIRRLHAPVITTVRPSDLQPAVSRSLLPDGKNQHATAITVLATCCCLVLSRATLIQLTRVPNEPAAYGSCRLKVNG